MNNKSFDPRNTTLKNVIDSITDLWFQDYEPVVESLKLENAKINKLVVLYSGGKITLTLDKRQNVYVVGLRFRGLHSGLLEEITNFLQLFGIDLNQKQLF